MLFYLGKDEIVVNNTCYFLVTLFNNDDDTTKTLKTKSGTTLTTTTTTTEPSATTASREGALRGSLAPRRGRALLELSCALVALDAHNLRNVRRHYSFLYRSK